MNPESIKLVLTTLFWFAALIGAINMVAKIVSLILTAWSAKEADKSFDRYFG